MNRSDGPFERIGGVLRALSEPDPLPRLRRATVPVLAVAGASLMVAVDEGQATLAWSGDVSERLEDLQTTTGEGPVAMPTSSRVLSAGARSSTRRRGW